MKQKFFQLSTSFTILFFMLFLGEQIANFIPLGISGSIWGLLLLFICLMLKIIKIDWVIFGARLLIRYMAVLFIPISVGVIQYSDLLMNQAKILLIPNIISTILTLVFIGMLADYCFSQGSFSRLRKKVLKKRARDI